MEKVPQLKRLLARLKVIKLPKKFSSPFKKPLILRQKPKNYSLELKKLLKQKKLKITALIPAYNEEPRIKRVLETVCSYPYFTEVIVVNDGSTDNTKAVVESFGCEKLKLINLPKNMGKTDAVLTGMKQARGDIVVMIDADLVNLHHSYLDKLIYLVASKEYDMTILDRSGDRLSPFGLAGIARLMGGERAFWRKDFLKLDLKGVKNYSLEGAMNMEYLKRGKKVRTVLAPDLTGEWQLFKWGIATGVKRYLKEFWEVYKATGVRNYYVQLTEVADDPIAELYTLMDKTKKNKIARELLRLGILAATTVASLGVIGYLILHHTKKRVRKSIQKISGPE